MTDGSPDKLISGYGGTAQLSVSVVICTYTEDRWNLLTEAVRSAKEQSCRPREIIVSVDHNAELYRKCVATWSTCHASDVPIIIVQNRFGGRLGSTRNTAAEIAAGNIIAFLDDDASALPNWLDELVRGYEDPRIMAIGGRPVARFEVQRPRWFPEDFDWVFGCAYKGLPSERRAVRRLIGANMSVRRNALVEVGGFHSDNHDDMDLSHRLAQRFGAKSVVYEPSAVVFHHVPEARLTWSYFWRRCYYVNRGKVSAFHEMKSPGNLRAELEFVSRSIMSGAHAAMTALIRGRTDPLVRFMIASVGIALAAAGHLDGRMRLVLGRTRPETTRGFDAGIGVASISREGMRSGT